MLYPGSIYPGLTTFLSLVGAVATAEPSWSPCPAVTVSITGLSGTEMTIYRSALGSRGIVRGCDSLPVVGDTFEVTDYEAPFGVPVAYDVVCSTAGVVEDQGSAEAVTLAVEDVWISDPLAPSVSKRVVLGGNSLGGASYRRPGGILPLSGGSTPTAVVGVRQVAQAIPLSISCFNEDDETGTIDVLRAADPLLIRTPPGYRILPRTAYVTVDDWQLEIPPQGGGVDAFSFLRGTGAIVAPPTPSIVVPPRTYADVRASFSSYGDIPPRLTPSTYLKLLRG